MFHLRRREPNLKGLDTDCGGVCLWTNRQPGFPPAHALALEEQSRTWALTPEGPQALLHPCPASPFLWLALRYLNTDARRFSWVAASVLSSIGSQATVLHVTFNW